MRAQARVRRGRLGGRGPMRVARGARHQVRDVIIGDAVVPQNPPEGRVPRRALEEVLVPLDQEPRVPLVQ